MNEAIGVRFNNVFLKKIEKLSKEELLDRSSTIRKLVYLGYRDLIKKKVAEDYKKGKITISEAANRAEMTVWEMEKYLVEQGYKSDYSIEDFNEELELISG